MTSSGQARMARVPDEKTRVGRMANLQSDEAGPEGKRRQRLFHVIPCWSSEIGPVVATSTDGSGAARLTCLICRSCSRAHHVTPGATREHAL